MKRTDQYGLHGHIKVLLQEDAMGNVTIRPVSDRVEKLVAESNQYDHHGDIFIQEAHVEEWKDTLPRQAFFNRGREWNDNNVFMMDSWTFRHLVGGQSD